MALNTITIHTLFVIIAILAAVAGRQYLKYRTTIATIGAFVLFALTIELFCYALQWSILPVALQYYIFSIQIIAFLLLSIFFEFFGYHIDSQDIGKNIWIYLLIVSVPVIFLGVRLFFGSAAFSPENMITYPPRSPLDLEIFIGPWNIFIRLFYFSVCSAAVYASLRIIILDKDPLSRFLSMPMLIGILFIMILSLLEILEIQPFWPISLIQIGLAIISLVFFYYAVISRFGGIPPIGREIVFDVIQDGIILLDANHKIVDINSSAKKQLGLEGKTVKNKDLSAVWPEIANTIINQAKDNLIVKELQTTSPYVQMNTQITISRLYGLNNTTTGRLIFIRNVTGLEAMEKALINRNQVVTQNNSIMEGLAEINLNFQAVNIHKDIFSILNDHLHTLKMNNFIAKLNFEGLVIENVSFQNKLVRQIESISGIKILGYPLQREKFPELYSYLDSENTDHIHTTFGGNQINTGWTLDNTINIALDYLGVNNDTPIVVFHLTAGSKKIGMMGIWGKGLREELINPLRILAGQVAWAIERVDLNTQILQRSSELERSNQLITALANVSAQMGRTSESSTALAVLGTELEAIGLHCVLADVNPGAESITFRYASFEEKIKKYQKRLPGFHFIGYELPRNLWPRTRVIDEGIAVWYTEIFSIFSKMFPMVPNRLFQLALKQAEITNEDHLCILPLMVDGKVNGVLPIWGKTIKQTDTPALLVFAHQVAEFLRMAQNNERESARADSLSRSYNMITALYNVAASLETTSNPDEVFETLGKEMRTIHLQCMVGILEDDKKYLKIQYLSIQPEIDGLTGKLGVFWPKEIRIPRHLWPTEKAVTDQVPYWDPNPIINVSRMFPFIPKKVFEKTFEMAGMRKEDQVCYLPMIIDEDVIGVLAVWGPEIEVEDIPALSIFSNQVSSAIKSATLLNQANEEILIRREAESKIQTALTEKEVLLREIHHRVKNNLQIITSLLNLQIAQSKETGSIEALRESQTRVRAMALIHEKLYQSNDLARINLSSYINSLLNYLSQTYRLSQSRVSTRVEVTDIMLDLDTAIPCGLIINELVSNALKYAFPDNVSGTVLIKCEQVDKKDYVLTVADDGIGLPKGMDPQKTSSLGLKLVFSLTKQIGGDLQIIDDHGTRFEIRFSLTSE